MHKARKTNSSYEYTNEMSAYDLFVIDDFGLMKLDMDKCRYLFEIIETRDSRKSHYDCISAASRELVGFI